MIACIRVIGHLVSWEVRGSGERLPVVEFYLVDPCALRDDRVASNLQAVDDLRDVACESL